MNNNHLPPASVDDHHARLRSIAGELLEIHSLLSLLCNELGGGGIVQARHLEPMLASTVPKLRDAVDAMHELSEPLNGGAAPDKSRLI